MQTEATAEDLKKCGVYKITNTINGKFYIGSTAASFRRRWRYHVQVANNGKHANSRLQRSWKKHGASAFVFSIVETTHPEHAVACEQVFLDWLKPCDPEVGTGGNVS